MIRAHALSLACNALLCVKGCRPCCFVVFLCSCGKSADNNRRSGDAGVESRIRPQRVCRHCTPFTPAVCLFCRNSSTHPPPPPAYEQLISGDAASTVSLLCVLSRHLVTAAAVFGKASIHRRSPALRIETSTTCSMPNGAACPTSLIRRERERERAKKKKKSVSMACYCCCCCR